MVLVAEDFKVEPHYSTENPNVEIYQVDDLSRLNSMRILAIKHQQFHVMINLVIQGQQILLKTLIVVGLTSIF